MQKGGLCRLFQNIDQRKAGGNDVQAVGDSGMCLDCGAAAAAAEPLSSVMARRKLPRIFPSVVSPIAQTMERTETAADGGEAEKNDPELEALQKQMHESCENRLTQLGSSETEKRRFGEERKKWQEAVAAVFKSGLSATVANDIAKEAYRNNRWCSNEISGISNRVYLATLDQLKDDPKKVLKSMQALADKNDSAAAEYLILSTIYQPEKRTAKNLKKLRNVCIRRL